MSCRGRDRRTYDDPDVSAWLHREPTKILAFIELIDRVKEQHYSSRTLILAELLFEDLSKSQQILSFGTVFGDPLTLQFRGEAKQYTVQIGGAFRRTDEVRQDEVIGPLQRQALRQCGQKC